MKKRGKVKARKTAKRVKRTKKKTRKTSKTSVKHFPTLKLNREKDIAMDFAIKVYEKFSKIIKSVILFGSQVKGKAVSGSDIDLVIIIDDASVKFDQELIAWYREELGKLIKVNPYKKELHVNTVKLTTWWTDLIHGDPVVVNILRYGEVLIDFGGFFLPLKILLQEGKINSTPESIYTVLQRTPLHIARSRACELNAIEGLYWAMVDSAHAALMAVKKSPPSPEHIPLMLKETFADQGLLKMGYVTMFRDLYILHRRIIHGEIRDLKGAEIDVWQERTEDFVSIMTQLVKDIV